MTVIPKQDYIEELCETFYTAFIETQKALGSVAPGYEYENWDNVPNDVKEPIRMSVRTVVEYIQTDMGHDGDAEDMAKGQIRDHLGDTEDQYEIAITEKVSE